MNKQYEQMSETEVDELLSDLDPSMNRDDWVIALMAVKSELGEDGIDIAYEWSELGDNFVRQDFSDTWDSLDADGGITIGSLKMMSAEAGENYAPSRKEKDSSSSIKVKTIDTKAANDLWDKGTSAANHPYLVSKGIDSIVTTEVRQYGEDLLVPLHQERNGSITLVNIETITPYGQKKGLFGVPRKGTFFYLKGNLEQVIICEGFATSASIHAATQDLVFASMGKGNLKAISKMVRKNLPEATIIIAGDIGSEKAANDAAVTVDGYVCLPSLVDDGSDFNDLHQHKGLDAVRADISGCIKPKLWGDIEPFNTALLPIQELDISMLPDAFKSWVNDSGHRMQCKADFIAIPALVAASTLIGRKVRIHPKQKDCWEVIPNLWGAIVGRPSCRKSPAIREAFKPINNIIDMYRNK